ncbi:MAG: hydrolase [Ruminococcaceae bacterium]|nr:hydrolase [Oscillospiraceae bacterium]
MRNRFACLCCGCKTLASRGEYDICPVCFWEDDPEARNPDEMNDCNGVSLTEARENYKKFGACREDMLLHVRKPSKEEL